MPRSGRQETCRSVRCERCRSALCQTAVLLARRRAGPVLEKDLLCARSVRPVPSCLRVSRGPLAVGLLWLGPRVGLRGKLSRPPWAWGVPSSSTSLREMHRALQPQLGQLQLKVHSEGECSSQKAKHLEARRDGSRVTRAQMQELTAVESFCSLRL